VGIVPCSKGYVNINRLSMRVIEVQRECFQQVRKSSLGDLKSLGGNSLPVRFRLRAPTYIQYIQVFKKHYPFSVNPLATNKNPLVKVLVKILHETYDPGKGLWKLTIDPQQLGEYLIFGMGGVWGGVAPLFGFCRIVVPTTADKFVNFEISTTLSISIIRFHVE